MPCLWRSAQSLVVPSFCRCHSKNGLQMYNLILFKRLCTFNSTQLSFLFKITPTGVRLINKPLEHQWVFTAELPVGLTQKKTATVIEFIVKLHDTQCNQAAHHYNVSNLGKTVKRHRAQHRKSWRWEGGRADQGSVDEGVRVGRQPAWMMQTCLNGKLVIHFDNSVIAASLPLSKIIWHAHSFLY